MNLHIEAMVDRNVYDHIIVHSGTNDVDKLRVTMAECTNCLVWSHICPQGRQHKN